MSLGASTSRDGTWSYTWEHGRELASMSDGTTTWTYTYDANGMRTQRTNGTTTYSYVYNGSQLTGLTVADGTTTHTMRFAYDANGVMFVKYNGLTYQYVTNLQGDVIAILDLSGNAVVEYTYDAWGNILSMTGSLASTLGEYNPLRYRSYVYDQETGLYYLQSRYYNPKLGRFINADALVSTGQGILGNNMFLYCLNNPIMYVDPDGCDCIGFGFQFEVRVGDISYGFEVVIYTDDEICNGRDFVVAVYGYSGYDVSVGDLQKFSNFIETLITTFVYDTYSEDLYAFYSAVTLIYSGAGVSGGAYLLFGNDEFDDPSDYSGGFETWSGSMSIKGATVTGFHSFSETCDAYGIKIGAQFNGVRASNNFPFGVSYSRSYYSQPLMWEV